MANQADKANPAFWQVPVSVLLVQLAASPEGLSIAEAAARLARFGPNQIHGEKKRALVLQFLAKFRNPWLIACSLSVVAAAVLLQFTSAGGYLGFVAPPAFFFLILAAMLLAYLLAVEVMKRWFFRHLAPE
jgi:magnesium-transporting ATPase (P-type)